MKRAGPDNLKLAELIGHRYRQDGLEFDAPFDGVLAVLLSHRSTRAYLPQPIEPDTLKMIVAAAHSASTSSNMQAWSVVAVQDPDRKSRLAKLAAPNPHIEEAPLLLLWVADLSRTRAIAQKSGHAGEALDYFESFLVGVIDATLAAQNAAVAIASMGLGSCYIGGMRNNPDQVAEELALPAEACVIFGLTVGRPDPKRPNDIKPRLPQQSVLHHEQYDSANEAAMLDAYDEAMRAFQSEQNMPAVGWTERIAQRVESASSLKSRAGLLSELKKRGFKLV